MDDNRYVNKYDKNVWFILVITVRVNERLFEVQYPRGVGEGSETDHSTWKTVDLQRDITHHFFTVLLRVHAGVRHSVSCVSLSSLICTRKYWLTCVLAYFPRIRRSTGFLKLLCINLIFTLSKMPRNSLDKQHVVSQAFRYHIAGIPPR